MNFNDLMEIGATVFRDSNLSGDAGSQLDIDAIISALSGLTEGSGQLDIGSILEKLNSGGLGDIASSWLGDGANETISPDQISEVIGSDQIAEFANKLGLGMDEAAGGLSDALPQMIDKASSSGSLLESLGGIEGVIGLAGKLFGRS